MTDAENQPADHAPPAPPAPPAPGPAAGSQSLLQALDVTPDGMIRAIRSGVVAYAAAWVVAMVSLLLALVLAVVEDSADGISWWWLLTGPGQLVAMAFHEPLTFSASSGGEGMSASGSFSSTAPLLVVLLAALYASFRLARRDASTTASTKGAVWLALTSGATFVVVALVIALVLRVGFGDDDGSTKASAAGFQLVLLGLVATAAAALLGRRPWPTWSLASSVPLAARGAWRGVLTHLAVFSALTLAATVVWVVVEGEAAVLLVLPAAFANVIVYAVTLGHLGALEFGGFGSFLGQSGQSSDAVWLFSGGGVDRVLWLLLPFAVAGTLASAVVLHRWGAGAPRTPAHWAWAAATYGATGGVLTLVGTASQGFGSGYGSGSASFGPAPWFFLVLAAWGLLAEAAARVVGRTLGDALPSAWVARATGEVGLIRPVGASSAAPAGAAAPAVPATPMDPRTRRIVVAVAGVGAVVVLAVVGVSVVGQAFFGPEKPVEDYVAALSEGRAADALELVRSDYSSDERVLLTDEVLAGSKDRISDVEIGDVRTVGDTATVTVDYTVDGSQQSQDISLRRSGSRFVVFDDWEIADPGLGGVSVTAEGATGLEVDGREIPVDDLDDGVDLPMFPGTYEIAASSGSRYLSYESESVTVGDDSESLRFEIASTDELQAEVDRQVGSFLQACMQRPEAEPDGCPNRTYGYDLTDVRWSLDAAPTVDLQPDYEGGWRVSTRAPGQASVAARQPALADDDATEPYTDDVALYVSGDVAVDGDQVTVTVDDRFF